MGLRKLLGWTFVVAALAVAFSAAPAMAASASFKVQTTADGNQAHPGTTNCATASDAGTGGKCTLRSSIEAADNEPSGTDVTIDVPAGTYKFSVANPPCIQCAPPIQSSYQLEILSGPSSITITGAGASSTIIDANFLDRVFDVGSGANATISGVTIEHGTPVTGPPGSPPPGAAGAPSRPSCPSSTQAEEDGGAILQNGTLTLEKDVITDSLATGNGGGIDNNGSGPLIVRDTAVTDNVSCNSTNGLSAGGGINTHAGAPLTIRNSTVSGNQAADNGDGGGVAEQESAPGNTKIYDTTISHNSGFNGGGVAADGGGSFLLFGDLLSKNTASNNGGGFSNGGGDTDLFVDTTIAGNSAGGFGGGIAAGDNAEYAPGETISFSTLDGNSANNGGGNIGVSEVGGAILDDSIVIRGVGGNCPGFGVTDNGYNVFDDTSDAGAECGATPSTHDVVTASPKVGPLAQNGGPTMTEALLSGSPAIDSANMANCTSETKDTAGNEVDQRNVPRPEGAGCDRGAFEATPNLGVSSSSQKSSIFVGQQDTINDTVENSGPTNAVDSTFTDPAAGFTIDSVTTSKGMCTHTTTTISCQLGTITSGGRVRISFVITGRSKGTVLFRSKVATNGDDLDQANNHALTSVTVKNRPTPPPPPPTPAKPSVHLVRLGPACRPEKSTIDLKAMARAAAGIKSLAIAVSGNGFSKKWSFTPGTGKTVRRDTLREHLQGSALLAGRTYRVTAKVVDKLGRADKAHTTFTVCKPPPKRGFTG